jgi:threonine synthase
LKYISTRGEAPELAFDDVMLTGLARDGGLYLPQRWPTFDAETIAGLAGRPFADVATEIMSPFVGDCISKAKLRKMADEAYGSFEHPAVTPLRQLDSNFWVLELFHGPTLAFKDVAMQILARLMDHILAERGQRVTIVGATSGDTGGAAIEAFRHCDRADVVILFPNGRVSDVQRRMMTTPTETNIHAVAVEGHFDDCQALVKGMFNDHAFRDDVNLSGVNSINWARIMAQITYYFVAGVALGAPGRALSFAVPTGNFGDIFAGWAAKRMGLPIEQLVIASNSNNILPRALETGVYEMRGVTATSSPSMDIQVSSNFERYLFEASGRNAAVVRAQMGSLQQSGRFEIGAAMADFQKQFAASWAGEEKVAETVRTIRKDTGYILDPHTACGVVAAQQHQGDRTTPMVVLATAHPAKFPDAVSEMIGERPQLPQRLSSLMRDEERIQHVGNDLKEIEALVRNSRDGGERSKARS